MITIRQALDNASMDFAESSVSPMLDAEFLLMHVLRCSRAILHTYPERLISADEYKNYQVITAQRKAGVPVAYLLGTQDFWKFTLQVTPAVLIPRPETELLVEIALKLAPPITRQVLDLGTGSGAIALALAYERPDWRITAIDNSPAALAVAQINAEKLNLPSIEWIKSDWFAAVNQRQFNIILSNPPYIAPQDPHLAALKYEPNVALVAPQQGMADLEKIILAAPQYLLPQGLLLVEHGYQQAAAVRDLLLTAGFKTMYTQTDLANHPRVTWGQIA